MGNELEHTQSRLLVQRLQALNLIAALLLLISLTPWGSGWSVFVLLAPEWQGVPNAVAYLMPHEHLVGWVAQAWAVIVEGSADAGLIDPEIASTMIREGLASEILLRGLALLFLVAGWVVSVRGSRRGAAVIAAQDVGHREITAVEPMLVSDVREEITQKNAVVLRALSEQQVIVQNMLLNPQAQPISEALIQLSENLQAFEQEIRRQQDAR